MAWKKAGFAYLTVLSALLCAGTPAARAETGHHAARHSLTRRHEIRVSDGHAGYHHRLAYHGHTRLAPAGIHRPLRYASGHRRYLHYAGAVYRHSRLQCVPYAREISHIQLSGDAFLWWAEAAGRYARGNSPVEGAVLNFRSVRRMPLGHVAVVTAVLDSRTILVTQANWVPGTITNDVTVQDVSPENDWSEVQVELGDSSHWGAAYPAYGFIYNRPASSTVIAGNGQADEVAEAPQPRSIATEAPDRNLQ